MFPQASVERLMISLAVNIIYPGTHKSQVRIGIQRGLAFQVDPASTIVVSQIAKYSPEDKATPRFIAFGVPILS